MTHVDETLLTKRWPAMMATFTTLVLLLQVDLIELSGVSASTSVQRLWTFHSTDVRRMLHYALTITSEPRLLQCLLRASPIWSTNLVCFQNTSRCLHARVSLLEMQGQQTEGYQCYASQFCQHGGELVPLNKEVHVVEPVSLQLRTMVCTKLHGLADTGVPLPTTLCKAPFTQHEFGCMYASNFSGSYIQAKRHCQSWGANLASPKTAGDGASMAAFYANKYGSVKIEFWVGLLLSDGVWQWPENGRELGAGMQWLDGEPLGDGITAIIWREGPDPTTYTLNDIGDNSVFRALCHVWNVY